MTAEDERIGDRIRTELEEGVLILDAAGLVGGRVAWSPVPLTGGITCEIGGRFDRYPDRDVHAVVEIDPSRIGWRIEAALYEHLDTDGAPGLICDLGHYRTGELEHALEAGRMMATAAWVALKDHLVESSIQRDRR